MDFFVFVLFFFNLIYVKLFLEIEVRILLAFIKNVAIFGA